MSQKAFDVIVVGAGHNGLVTACYLARSGLKVLVLERSDKVGGAAVSRQIYKDITYSNCSYVCSLLRPEIMRDLELPKYGLQIIPYEGGATMMSNGDYFAAYRDHGCPAPRDWPAIRRATPRPIDRYSDDVMRQCKFIQPLLMRTPPDPTSFRPRDLTELLYLGKRFYGMGEQRMYDTIRFWTMSAADFLDEYFESDVDQGHLSGSRHHRHRARAAARPAPPTCCCTTTWAKSTTTVGAWGFARGGMGAVTAGAGRRRFKASGGEIRTDAGGRPDPGPRRQGHAASCCDDGEEIRAPIVVSNLDVKRTFLKTDRRQRTCRPNSSSACAISRSAARRAS